MSKKEEVLEPCAKELIEENALTGAEMSHESQEKAQDEAEKAPVPVPAARVSVRRKMKQSGIEAGSRTDEGLSTSTASSSILIGTFNESTTDYSKIVKQK